MMWMIEGAASSMECAYHTIVTDHVLFPARVNSVMFNLLKTGVLVSIVSSFVFVVQGGELTVSVALTVGSLFFAYTV